MKLRNAKSVAAAERQFGADLGLTQLEYGRPVRDLPHGQQYTTSVGFGHAADGTIGWVVSVQFRCPGGRNYRIAESRGSKANSPAKFSNAALRIMPTRRAHRHAVALGLIGRSKT